jgi:hypothetical protein
VKLQVLKSRVNSFGQYDLDCIIIMPACGTIADIDFSLAILVIACSVISINSACFMIYGLIDSRMKEQSFYLHSN